MSMRVFGFWAMVLAVVLRTAGTAPALLARQPNFAPRFVVAVVVFALYVANTIVAARRIKAADVTSAADFIWAQGGVGLALAVALLMLL
jgi:hypothetical protein